MVFITGDTHRNFDRIEEFCGYYSESPDDIMIILGDVGINYAGNPHDWDLKRDLSELPITLFCIYGNHEKRPENISDYEEKEWHGGIVYWEPEFPNLIFAKDGEIYDFDGVKCIVIGGANSVDKHRRIPNFDWWDDEQPSDEIKQYVEDQLEKVDWKIDVVLSHTCPYQYMPREAFLQNVNEWCIDNSTEEWLDKIEGKLNYSRWYCGHFHTDKSDGDIKFFFHDIDEFYYGDGF